MCSLRRAAIPLTVFLLVATLEAHAHPHAHAPIVMGVAPQQEPTKVYAMWQPMVRYLQRETRQPFTFETASSIEEFQKRVLEGRYDLWWGNPLTYIQASRKLGYVAIARDTVRIAGLLVTRKADNITAVKELAGQKIAYSAPDAIGGTLLIQDALIRNGVPLDQTTPVFTGSHDSAYRAVLDGHAAAAGGVPRSFNALDAGLRDKLAILIKTEEVAPQPFAVHPRLFRGVVTQIQRALVKLNWTPEGRDILSSIQYKEIVISNDVDYDIHRDVAARLKIPF